MTRGSRGLACAWTSQVGASEHRVAGRPCLWRGVGDELAELMFGPRRVRAKSAAYPRPRGKVPGLDSTIYPTKHKSKSTIGLAPSVSSSLPLQCHREARKNERRTVSARAVVHRS